MAAKGSSKFTKNTPLGTDGASGGVSFPEIGDKSSIEERQIGSQALRGRFEIVEILHDPCVGASPVHDSGHFQSVTPVVTTQSLPRAAQHG